MGYVLFSPLGRTDPIRGMHDGPWLHICRQYRPKHCLVYESKAISEDDRLDDRYANTLQRLNRHLFTEDIGRYIILEKHQDDKCDKPHSYEYFFPIFRKLLYEMRERFPEDELLVNVSSGTPGMQIALTSLFHLMPIPMTLIQVSNFNAKEINKPVGGGYTWADEWDCNLDNEPDHINRCSKQQMEQFMMQAQRKALTDFIGGGEYIAADIHAASANLPHKTTEAIHGARLRSTLFLKDGGDALARSGFAEGAAIRERDRTAVGKCMETLLLMRLYLKRQEYDRFLLRISPVLCDLCELYAVKIGIDLNRCVVNGKWRIRENLPEAYLKVLDKGFGKEFRGGEYLSSISLLYLIEAFAPRKPSGAAQLIRELRNVETHARHPVAHELCAINERWIKEKTELSTEQIWDKLWKLLNCVREYTDECKESYARMNEHIVTLIEGH